MQSHKSMGCTCEQAQRTIVLLVSVSYAVLFLHLGRSWSYPLDPPPLGAGLPAVTGLLRAFT